MATRIRRWMHRKLPWLEHPCDRWGHVPERVEKVGYEPPRLGHNLGHLGFYMTEVVEIHAEGYECADCGVPLADPRRTIERPRPKARTLAAHRALQEGEVVFAKEVLRERVDEVPEDVRSDPPDRDEWAKEVQAHA